MKAVTLPFQEQCIDLSLQLDQAKSYGWLERLCAEGAPTTNG